MRAILPQPNLLIVGAPKSGTTSLLMWLRSHPEVYHPWFGAGPEAVESGFLIAGPTDIPISPSRPRGTLLLPHDTDVDRYKGEPWVIDKSPQHLYSRRALETVRDLMPDAKVIIALRDPYDLLISQYMQMWKSVNFDTPFEELYDMLQSQGWEANAEIAETWAFLTYPRYSEFVRAWVSELGSERVRVVTLASIAGNATGVLREISEWLEISPSKMPSNTTVRNTRGKLSNSPIRKFLREPPKWVFSSARLLLPSRSARKALLDPIRRRGWKHVPADKPEVPPGIESEIRARLREDTEFFEALDSHLPSGTMIG